MSAQDRLPDAEHQAPACGSCGSETDTDADHAACYGCGLSFAWPDLQAAYLDPDKEPCGSPCDNTWHRPGALREGKGFRCQPCALPEGHDNTWHWRGCTPVELEAGADS
ncbi:hypothetical protein [Pseudactinotalea sp. Z1732]|uniref:hypothetical protein n=1 Tax=Pseudactinotalea sp. Z1732 TaxID=3413026 RepID=UPI003C7D3045